MDQRDETFVPHVLAIVAGTTVDFPNNDETYHNVFSLSRARSFDLGRYAAGRSKSIRFDRPGIVRVFCDIHSHMSAFILVFNHPFFAMTDAEGRYRIENIPPGSYNVVAWNEGLASEPRVAVIPDAPTLKAAVDTNDPATVQNNASDYQNQLNSNLLLVTNKAGEVLATVGASPRAAIVVAGQPSVHKAINGQESLSLIPQPDGILHLVTVPIAIGVSHPDILGSLSVGFLLDDAFAGQLKQITGSEIAFGMDGQILASTLPRDARPALSALLGQSDRNRNVTLGAQ